MKIKNVFKRVSVDYWDAKSSAECDARELAKDTTGRILPYTVEMTLIKNKINKKNNWKAEVIIFEKQIDRDLYVINKDEKFIQFVNQKN